MEMSQFISGKTSCSEALIELSTPASSEKAFSVLSLPLFLRICLMICRTISSLMRWVFSMPSLMSSIRAFSFWRKVACSSSSPQTRKMDLKMVTASWYWDLGRRRMGSSMDLLQLMRSSRATLFPQE